MKSTIARTPWELFKLKKPMISSLYNQSIDYYINLQKLLNFIIKNSNYKFELNINIVKKNNDIVF